jgi:uncharacterized protein
MPMQLDFLRSFVIGLIACFAVATGFAKDAKASDPSEKRVLIITGEDGPVHNWRASTMLLKLQLEQDSRLHVEVLDDLKKLAATDLSPYAALILSFKNADPNVPGRAGFDSISDYVRKGGGLVVLHWASAAFEEFRNDYKKLAGRVWVILKQDEGGVSLETWKKLNEAERERLAKEQQKKGASGHDPYDLFTVRIVRKDHPITRGLADFQTVDELYTGLAGETPIEVLAQATSKVDGKAYPMAFTLNFGKGRVFHSPLGHDQAVNMPATAQLLRRGTAWVSGLDSQ